MPDPLFAFQSYCDNHNDKNRLILGHGSFEKSSLDNGTDENIAVTSTQAKFSWPISGGTTHTLSSGFNAAYTILDFGSLKPMSNGHLHTWNLPVSGTNHLKEAEIFYHITPTLSVSSNALKNPELMNSDSLQFNTSVIYKKAMGENQAWVLGLQSDHRIDEHRLYPLAGICWHAQQGWLLQLALPDLSIRKKISRGINLTLYAAPEGNKWQVFSKDMQRHSALTYNAIVTGLSTQWSITPRVELSLDIERLSRRKFSIVLDDNRLIEPSADSTLELRLSGEILF